MKHTPRQSLLVLLLAVLAFAFQADTAKANNYRGKCYKNYRSSYNKNCRSNWSRSNCKSRSYKNCCCKTKKAAEPKTETDAEAKEAAELEEAINIMPIPVSLQPEEPDTEKSDAKKTPELKMEDSKPTEAPKPKKAN